MKIYKFKEEPKADIGVIIGRFQVDNLHEGHKQLITDVLSRHDRVLILLGTTQILSTKNNPLDFISRKLMIESEFPMVVVSNIMDYPVSNKLWSSQVDIKIKEIFPIGSVLLYGSRDSFISSYEGKFDCVELDSIYTATGTEIREKIRRGIFDNPSFRAGQIYALSNTHDSAFSCVDVAILKNDEILLGRKTGREGYCFIGGFVDPTDTNYEHAARREVHEETGLVIESFKYISNMRIDDMRYRNENSKIFSTLFVGYYSSGRPQPNDDINELKWFKLSELKERLFIDSHKPFFKDLIKFLFMTDQILNLDIETLSLDEDFGRVLNDVVKKMKSPLKERFVKYQPVVSSDAYIGKTPENWTKNLNE